MITLTVHSNIENKGRAIFALINIINVVVVTINMAVGCKFEYTSKDRQYHLFAFIASFLPIILIQILLIDAIIKINKCKGS